MKKLQIVFLSLFVIGNTASAQIPNPSFEDSSFAKYPTSPKSWSTPNEFYKDFSDPSEALELYNDFDGTNSINLISDENTLDFNLAKGFAINGRPDSLIVLLDYYDLETDTLLIRTKNRETGNKFGYGEIKLTGDYTGSTPQRVGVKIDYPAPGFADSGVIQLMVLKGPNPMSEHNVDVLSIEFVNFIGNPLNVVPNKNFNEWYNDSVVTPTGWSTLTYAALYDGLESNFIPFEKFTTDASNESLAMVIENQEIEGDVFPGLLGAIPAESYFDYDGDIDDPTPMFPVDKKYASLLGDYKFTNGGQDTAQIMIAMFNNGQEIGIKRLNITENVATYQGFEAHIDYGNSTSIPDSAAIFITTGFDFEGTLGTQLFIDNLRFTETSSTKLLANNPLTIYPNPAKGVVKIDTNGDKLETIQVLNLQGKLVKVVPVSYNTIDISQLPAGTYILSAQSENKTYSQKITKTN